MKLDFNTVKGTPFGSVASAAICAYMNENPDVTGTIKLTEVDITVQVNGHLVDMEQFKTILTSENSLTGFRSSLNGLAERLVSLENTLGDCDTSGDASAIFDAFWTALSNVEIDLGDYVNPGVSQDDYYNTDLSYARDTVSELRGDLDRLLGRSS